MSLPPGSDPAAIRFLKSQTNTSGGQKKRSHFTQGRVQQTTARR